jgi:hypothetical protein
LNRFFLLMKTEETFPNASRAERTIRQTFCPICRAAVELISLARAAELYETTADDISSLIRRRAIHCLHNLRGEVLICFDSLRRADFYVRETGRLGFDTARDLYATRG